LFEKVPGFSVQGSEVSFFKGFTVQGCIKDSSEVYPPLAGSIFEAAVEPSNL
jgi:hypothetical protein